MGHRSDLKFSQLVNEQKQLNKLLLKRIAKAEKSLDIVEENLETEEVFVAGVISAFQREFKLVKKTEETKARKIIEMEKDILFLKIMLISFLVMQLIFNLINIF